MENVATAGYFVVGVVFVAGLKRLHRIIEFLEFQLTHSLAVNDHSELQAINLYRMFRILAKASGFGVVGKRLLPLLLFHSQKCFIDEFREGFLRESRDGGSRENECEKEFFHGRLKLGFS